MRGALATVGINFPPEALSIQPFSIAGGRAGYRELTASSVKHLAIICTTDLMAVGALAQAHACGLKVPDDMSITGFDDIDLAGVAFPPLTTVAVPIREMGELVGDHILARMQGAAPMPSVALPVELKWRASTAGLVA